MNPQELPRVRAALAEALQLPPKERAEFLRLRFADAPELADEARGLVESHEHCGDFLKTPIVERVIGWSEDRKPRRLGLYELLQPLGRGGSATVYLARRAGDLYERKVAIKTLNGLSQSEDTFRRFRREIQMLSRVDHPYIVRLVDADITEEGVAYIITEFVEGVHLDRFAAPLSLREKLHLFSKICEGVAAAHSNLVVHRDLKPSNILVAPDGTPKLLDFGIAVLLDDDSRLTETGLERMTVHYASPEQLRGEKSITVTSDVYSLGVLLYELIAGSAPFPFPKHELALRVQTEDPIPLKKVLRELRAIVEKALQKNAFRRYESVDRLRDDVMRFLNGYPVIAHGDGAGYKLMKFARKHWLALSVASCTMCLLATLTIVSIASSRKAQRQSIRITDLLSTVLGDVTIDRQHRTSLRVLRLVEETRLNYLNSLDQEYPNDFKIAKLRFGARRGLATVQGFPATLNLGDTAGARENYERSIKIGEEIRNRWGENSNLRPLLATAYIELGSVLVEMDRLDEARSKFEHAQSLAEGDSGKLAFRAQLEALAQKSRILNLTGRQSEALVIRRQIVDQRRALFREDPVGMNWEFPGSLCSYGELLRETGRFEEAEKAYGEALPMIERLVQADYHPLDNVWHLGRENEEYAKVLLALGRDTLARRHLTRAIELYREVNRQEPDATSDQRSLAVCLGLLGKEMADHGEGRRGRKLLEEALKLSEQAARQDPGSVRAQREMLAIRERFEEVEPKMANR